ncbi:hypothetical protein ACFL2B_02720, partial [Patescibacteria group bacterium]
MTIYTRVVLVAVLVAGFSVGGFFAYSEATAATSLADAASLSQNNTFTNTVNGFTKGITIGVQGSGGVTFFNGTMINDTKDEDGNGIPLTAGDDFRIDGEIWRGVNSGTEDDMPVKINDDLEVSGTINNSAISPGAVTQTGENYGVDIATTTQSGTDFDTAETVTLTTDDSTLLINLSAVLANDTNNSSARAIILVDGEGIAHTTRRGTSNTGGEVFTLASNALVNVSAGEHTVSIGFN